MAPSDEQVISALKAVVARLYASDRDGLTVNIVRNVVELELGLEQGVLKGEEWKERSKGVVMGRVNELDAIELASAKKPTKKGDMKNASFKTKPPAKRKKSPTPDADSEVELGSEASDEEEPRSAKKQKTAAVSKKAAKKPMKKAEKAAPKKKLVQRKKKEATSSDEDDQSSDGASDDVSEDSFHESESDAPKKKASGRRGGKKVVNSESEDKESELSDVNSEAEAPKKGKKVAKKASPKNAAPKERLVQKTKIVVSDDDDEDALSSPVSDGEEEEDSESEMPAMKRQRAGAKEKTVKVAKGRATRKDAKKLSSTQVADSDDDGEDVKSQSPTKSKNKVVSDDEDDGDEDVESKAKSPTKSPKNKQEVDDEESEMSDVLDPEPVKEVRKSAAPSKSTKSTTKSAPKSRAPAKSSDPKAEEIKTLTQQLGKCGVRKVWGAYLNKQFGDDHKAKVRHLKQQLRDIGMEGRFSEQRAKEIKERRELEGDLEVLKETASKWGVDPFGTGGRPRRRTAASRRSLKEAELSEEEGGEKDGEDEDEEDDSDDSNAEGGSASGSGCDGEGGEDDEEGSGEDVKPKSVKKARKGRQDAGLAFLGSESESD